MDQLIVHLVIGLCALGLIPLGLLFARMKKGSVSGTKMGSRRIDLRSQADPQIVFDRIRTLAGKFKVDEADPKALIVVLSSSPTLATWGFLYPILIHREAEGSRIEIGIQSRLFQLGPLVTRWHKQCAAAIEESVNAGP